jgi:hypothetical protein
VATYPISQVIRGSLEFQLAAGQSAFIVMHFGCMSLATATIVDVQYVATELNNLATNTYAGFQLTGVLSAQTQIVAAHARTVDPANPLADDLAIGQVGDQPGEPVPFETAYVVTHYSELASRRGRGRNFVPGLAVSTIDNGAFLAASVAAQQAVWTEWRTGLEVFGTCELVVWSPTNNSGRSVTGNLVRNILHHQSSRNP